MTTVFIRGMTVATYKNVDPLPAHDSPPTDRQVKIRVADGVTPELTTAANMLEPRHSNTYMTAGKPNPFAPFSHELSVEFTRAYDGAEILFVRHVLVLGSIPEEVPQVWTAATNPTLIFSIIRDPPGGASTATLVEGSTDFDVHGHRRRARRPTGRVVQFWLFGWRSAALKLGMAPLVLKRTSLPSAVVPV